MATLQEILNINFNSKITHLEDVEFQTLCVMFESLKEEINSAYNPAYDEFTDSTSIWFANSILQEIHNRICNHFNVEPTIVNVIPNDFYLHKNGHLEGGQYSFKTREIELGLLANLKEEYQSYFFNYLSDAWGTYHISKIFHETYHHIQMEMLKKYVNGEKLPKRFENEIKMLEIYFDSETEFKNPILSYFLNPIEIPARKFAFDCMNYLTKNQLISNTKEAQTLNNYNILNEIITAGGNLTNLTFSEMLWINNPASAGKNEVVQNFYNDVILYYKKLEKHNDRILRTIKANFKPGKTFIEKHSLTSIDLLALNYDFEKYKASTNKQEFLESIILSNRNALYGGMGIKCSNLPSFIAEIEMQKKNELEN